MLNRTARGAGVSVAGQGLGFVTQMAATIVLARLLTPSDFGVVTMVTTLSLLLTSIGLNGFTEAILQIDDVCEGLVSNLFWINVGVGALLTAGFAGAGWILAKFYGDPRVTGIAIGMSFTIILTSTSVLHLAVLKRAMHFTAVSAIDVLSRFISVLVAIVCGWAAWGYWALVAGAIVLPLCTSLGAWSVCRWVPSRPRRIAGTGAACAVCDQCLRPLQPELWCAEHG